MVIKSIAGLRTYLRRENHPDFSTPKKCGYDLPAAMEWFSWSGNYAKKTKSGCLVFVSGHTELSGCPFLTKGEVS